MKFLNSGTKKVLIQCPYANEGSKDFCSPKKPYVLDMNAPDFKELMEAHVQMHVERDSSLFGLTIKKFGCPICDWETKPFQSNNATKLKALGKEEMEAMVDLDDHITGNQERVLNFVALAESAKAGGKQEELDRLLELIEDYRGHKSCNLHETPGHEQLTYYFRDQDEKDLHTKLLHQPKIKPVNPKLKK